MKGSRRVYKLLVIKENSFSCYSVFLCKQLVNLSTCSLVHFSTKKLLYLAFSINFAIFANYLIHMYHMFVEIIDISYYEVKL
mgnify:FL=1